MQKIKSLFLRCLSEHRHLSGMIPLFVTAKGNLVALVFGPINYMRYHRRLQTVKYVHLMYSDKFNKPFVAYLNRYFVAKEHFVICLDCGYPDLPVGDNVAIVKTLYGFNLSFPNIKEIYTHSLAEWRLLDYFYRHQDILHKSCWLVWGGNDAFFKRRDDRVMKVCPRFGRYALETELVARNFNPKGVFLRIGEYLFPVNKDVLDSVKQDHDHAVCYPVVVQVNHSVDNSTVGMLEDLAKFKDKNIVVRTILSYCPPGNDSESPIRVIARRGKEIFGDKFCPVYDFMGAQKYAEFLAQNDILIMCQARSQGVGNTLASLYLGKKVYIRGDVASYQGFRADGADIGDSRKIRDMEWEEFVDHPFQSSQANHLCAIHRIDPSVLARQYATALGWSRC